MNNPRLSRQRFLKIGGCALAGTWTSGLVGCGSGGRAAESLGLSVTGTDDPRKKYFVELAEAFAEESGRWIEPVYVGIEQSRQKLTTQVGAGYPPDAAYYPWRWLADYANLGLLAPVDAAVTEGFVHSAVEGGKVGGELYGMPWVFSTRALFYRSDLFEEAGIEPPRNWDEMLDAARTLHDPEGRVYGFAIAGLEHTSTAVQFLIWLWAAGGEVLSNDNERGRLQLA